MNVDLTWDQIIEGLREARFMREQEVREVLSTIDTTWNVMAIILDYVLEQVTASKQLVRDISKEIMRHQLKISDELRKQLADYFAGKDKADEND